MLLNYKTQFLKQYKQKFFNVQNIVKMHRIQLLNTLGQADAVVPDK